MATTLFAFRTVTLQNRLSCDPQNFVAIFMGPSENSRASLPSSS
jgi:hypothetical protein